MSRLKREGNPPSGQLASPVPQAWDPSINDFREITGQSLGDGRFGADGLQWGKTAGGLYLPIKVDNEGRQEVTLSGNDVVIGLLADRPPASEMRGRGYYAWDETDGHKLKYSDGTDWVVNQ